MKPITITNKTHEDIFRMPAILHVEGGGKVVWPKVGTVQRDPVTEATYVMTPVKGKPRYHKSAVKILEYLHLQSGIKVTTC